MFDAEIKNAVAANNPPKKGIADPSRRFSIAGLFRVQTAKKTTQTTPALRAANRASLGTSRTWAVGIAPSNRKVAKFPSKVAMAVKIAS